MVCEYCDNEIPSGAQRCPSCGATVRSQPTIVVSPAPSGQANIPPSRQTQIPVQEAQGPVRSRVAYILLGIFLGLLGIHNFYAGRTYRGLGQLLTTLLAGWLFIPLIGVWIWSIVDICALTTDGDGKQFQ